MEPTKPVLSWRVALANRAAGAGRSSTKLVILWIAAWLATSATSGEKTEPAKPPTRSLGAVSKLHGHQGSVLGLAFSSDGRWLASASSDRTVQLWNLETGRAGWTLRGHADKVWAVAFSPDRSLVASGGDDRTIRLWKTITGEPLATLGELTDRVNTLAFSPDGHLLASGGKDKSVRLWNVAARSPLRSLVGPTGGVQCVAFSPNGQTLAVASTRVYLFDIANGKLQMTLSGHASYVTGVAFSSDGQRLASTAADHTVRVWNLADGRSRLVLKGHTDRANAVRFADHDKLLISAGQDSTVRVWDAENGRALQTLTAHREAVWSLAVSPDGLELASGSGDKSIQLWRVGGSAPPSVAPFAAGDLAEIKPLAGPPRGGRGEAQADTVMLTAHDAYDDRARAGRGLLLREIARQALLIAARDELQLATRDTTLRQRLFEETEPDNLPLEMVVVAVPGESARISVFRRDEKRLDLLQQFRFDLPEADAIEALVAECEKLAGGEFVALLKTAGFQGQRHAVRPEGQVDAATASLLPQMHFVAQFNAIRRLHEQIEREGESAPRLDALSFAYANLGLLTERLWSPAHKAFKARSLLYAQRRWSAAPDDPTALWHRAYARAVVGRHHTALEDWAAAESRFKALRADGGDDEPARPAWADLLAAFLRGEQRLHSDDIVPPRWYPLRDLLALTTVECFTQSSLLTEAAQRILSRTSDCPRALDALASFRSLGTIAQGAEGFASALNPAADPSVYRRLLEIDDLPAGVRQRLIAATGAEALDSNELVEQRAAIVRALLEAGAADRGEPAWGVLGALVLETEFVGAYRQWAYERALAVPGDETAWMLSPVLADHPYALFISSHVADRAQRNATLRTLAGKIDAADLQMTEAPMFDQLLTVQRLARSRLSSAALAHNDDVFRDLVETCQRYPAAYREHFVRRLRRIAPHQAATAWLSIREDWPYARGTAAQWEEQFATIPPVLAALGEQYAATGRYKDAERCLTGALRSQHDWSLYRALAEVYQRQDRPDKWRTTLEEFLEQPSPGLEHARARVLIAQQLMRDGQAKDALPFAADAAATGAAWAMECLAECYERLERWDEAESLVRGKVQRYPALAVDWYAWCRRTEHGDVQAAAEYARQQVAAWTDPSPRTLADQIALFQWLTAKPKEALRSQERAFASSNNPGEGVLIALAAAALGETDRRDAALKQAIEHGAEYRRRGRTRTELLDLAEQFRVVWSAPKEAKLSRQRVDNLLRDAPPDEQSRLACYAGRFWQLQGDKQAAKAYYLRSLNEPEHAPHRVRAALWLKECDGE